MPKLYCSFVKQWKLLVFSEMAQNVLIGLIAILDLYFLWFEMFAWTTKGRKIFKNFPPELFEPTKPMAYLDILYRRSRLEKQCFFFLFGMCRSS